MTSGASGEIETQRLDASQVSESQKEFIDLAFRMALFDVVKQKGQRAMLVIETPEASLDSVFVDSAGDLLRRFATGEHGKPNVVIATTNLNGSRMIRSLLGLDAPTRPKKQTEVNSFVINMLRRRPQTLLLGSTAHVIGPNSKLRLLSGMEHVARLNMAAGITRAWLVLMVRACQDAGLSPIPKDRFHQLIYLSNCLAPLFEETPAAARIVKFERGPFYPEVQRQLDHLSATSVLDICDVRYIRDKFGAWMTASYAPNTITRQVIHRFDTIQYGRRFRDPNRGGLRICSLTPKKLGHSSVVGCYVRG